MTTEDIPVGKFGYVKGQVVDWFILHRNRIALGSVGLIAILALGGQTVGWLRGDAQADYLAAETAYTKWDGQKEALGKLEKIIRKHPELRAKYEGGIAQKLIRSSESGLAEGYASAVLKRVGHFSPYYTQFSKDSLLIGEGKLSEALASAKELKVSMERDDAFWEKGSQVVRHGTLLYAYNLLRIAILEDAAGSHEGELAAWRELKQNAGWYDTQPATKTYDPEAYALIQKNFHKNDVSLLDYISYREATLTSSEKRP